MVDNSDCVDAGRSHLCCLEHGVAIQEDEDSFVSSPGLVGVHCHCTVVCRDNRMLSHMGMSECARVVHQLW